MRYLIASVGLSVLLMTGCGSSESSTGKTGGDAKGGDASMSGPAAAEPTMTGPPAKIPGAAPAGEGDKPGEAPEAGGDAPATEKPAPEGEGNANAGNGNGSESDPAAPPGGLPKAADPGALFSEAQQQVRSGDVDGAFKTLKKIYAIDSKDRIVLLSLIQMSQSIGIQKLQQQNVAEGHPLFLESAQYARSLMKLGELDADEATVIAGVLYNEACVLATNAKPDEAVASLTKAIEMGFADLKLLDEDTDLQSLRELDSFKELRASATSKIEARQKEEVARQQKEALEALAAHQPFDFDFSLTDLEGKTVNLADYKGKVLIVDIWGTWCPPCRMEIPHFVDLHKKYREQGFEIVGINYERTSPDKWVEVIKDFVSKNGMTYTCVIGDDATREKVPDFQGFPTTLFIDRTGKVRLKEVGYKPLPVLEAVVVKLLEEAAAQ